MPTTSERPKNHSKLRIAGGLGLLIAGLILAIPGVPGPGIPIIVVALVILSDRFVWAHRALSWLQKKGHQMGLPTGKPGPPRPANEGGDSGVPRSETDAH